MGIYPVLDLVCPSPHKGIIQLRSCTPLSRAWWAQRGL